MGGHLGQEHFAGAEEVADDVHACTLLSSGGRHTEVADDVHAYGCLRARERVKVACMKHEWGLWIYIYIYIYINMDRKQQICGAGGGRGGGARRTFHEGALDDVEGRRVRRLVLSMWPLA